jgi:hypothetical protein
VVLVVPDLDSAAAAFRARGFRIKQGRLHANNLLNRHIKFRDGTSLELMTLAGRPGDALAQDYADLLRGGARGVYVGLTVPSIDGPARAAKERGLESRRSSSGPARFLSFPAQSAAAAIFFGADGPTVHDPDSLVTHTPPAGALEEVWIEGAAALVDLLLDLGANRCGPVRSTGGLAGERIALSRGFVVVTPATPGVRPRVLGVVLRSPAPLPRIQPLPTFWLEYRR